mmetsp:Transcript_62193/g.192767  ORF Transcript_62193/g.192767 Transcript_62193/m.192767 type:complete len:258 (+) Transcript_62193:160-933(+)
MVPSDWPGRLLTECSQRGEAPTDAWSHRRLERSLQPPQLRALGPGGVLGGRALWWRGLCPGAGGTPHRERPTPSLPQRRRRGRGDAERDPVREAAPSAAAAGAEPQDLLEGVRLPLAPQPRHVRPLHEPRDDEVQIAEAQRHPGVEARYELPLRRAPALAQGEVPHGLRAQPHAELARLRGQGTGELSGAGRGDVQDDVAVVRGDDAAHLGAEAAPQRPPPQEPSQCSADARGLRRRGVEKASDGDVRRVERRLVGA